MSSPAISKVVAIGAPRSARVANCKCEALNLNFPFDFVFVSRQLLIEYYVALCSLCLLNSFDIKDTKPSEDPVCLEHHEE